MATYYGAFDCQRCGLAIKEPGWRERLSVWARLQWEQFQVMLVNDEPGDGHIDE